MTKLLAAFLTIGLTASSCASGPPVAADDLKLKRVVIYRNGVAYFEREGRVEGERVRFKVRGDEVGDFLASFAVIEKGGSSVRAASFPLKREEPTPPPDAAGSKPAEAKRRMETVVMELDGREHELAVGYIAEAPVWRPSYRLVLGNGPAHLQLWGIVQNLSGEDWTDTKLTLVADAPLALTAGLERPVIPGRPVLTDDGGAIAVLPQAETTLAEEPVAPAPSEVSEEAPAPAKSMMAPASRPLARQEGLYGTRKFKKSANGMRAMEDEALSRRAGVPSRARNLAALAAVAVSGGATRYELPDPVTVPDNHATMLLLADKEVPGEATYLFAPDSGVPDSACILAACLIRLRILSGSRASPTRPAACSSAGRSPFSARVVFLARALSIRCPTAPAPLCPLAWNAVWRSSAVQNTCKKARGSFRSRRATWSSSGRWDRARATNSRAAWISHTRSGSSTRDRTE